MDNCPSNCYGNGDCVSGTCHCFLGFLGPDCGRGRNFLINSCFSPPVIFFFVKVTFMPMHFANCTFPSLGLLQENGTRSDLWVFLLFVVIAVALATMWPPVCVHGQAKCHKRNFPFGNYFRKHDLKMWHFCLCGRLLHHCMVHHFNTLF